MKALAGIIWVAVAAVIAIHAVAPEPAYGYANERVAPAWVQQLAVKADAFWAERGVDACASENPVIVAPSLLDDDDQDGDIEMTGSGDGPAPDGTSEDVDAAGRGRPCNIWIVGWLIDDTSDPYLYGTALDLCTTIYHEAGHTGKLGHTEHGLMSPSGDTNPFECRVWARRFENRKWRKYRQQNRKLARGIG